MANDFYRIFDQNNDQIIEKSELVQCINKLGRKEYIGPKKLTLLLAVLGVKSHKLKIFNEGSSQGKILTSELEEDLFKKFKLNIDDREKINRASDNLKKAISGKLESSDPSDHLFIDYEKFLPFFLVLFFEFEAKKLLKSRRVYMTHLGIPEELEDQGGAYGENHRISEGLYKAFIYVLKGRRSLEEDVLTYEIIRTGLLRYNDRVLANKVTHHSIENILIKLRSKMQVDDFLHRESARRTMKEILPWLSVEICHELDRVRTNYQHWFGAAHLEMISPGNLETLFIRRLPTTSTTTDEELKQALSDVLKQVLPEIERKFLNALIKQRELLEEGKLYEALWAATKEYSLKGFFLRLTNETAFRAFEDAQGYEEPEDALERERQSLVLETPQEAPHLASKKKMTVLITHRQDKMKQVFTKYLLNDRYTPQATKDSKIDAPRKPNEKSQVEFMMEYQAVGRQINQKVEKREQKKLKNQKHTQESNAFLNNPYLNPSLLKPMMDTLKLDAPLSSLKQAVDERGDKMTYADSMKHLVSYDKHKKHEEKKSTDSLAETRNYPHDKRLDSEDEGIDHVPNLEDIEVPQIFIQRAVRARNNTDNQESLEEKPARNRDCGCLLI